MCSAVTRISDAAEINAALNDPEVIAALAPGYDELDASKFVNYKQHVALRSGDAVAIFFFLQPGVYQAHYAFPRHVRGKAAFEAAKNILHEMFTTYQAKYIVGTTPRECRAARSLNYRLGFRKIGESTDIYNRPCVEIELTREQWSKSS